MSRSKLFSLRCMSNMEESIMAIDLVLNLVVRTQPIVKNLEKSRLPSFMTLFVFMMFSLHYSMFIVVKKINNRYSHLKKWHKTRLNPPTKHRWVLSRLRRIRRYGQFGDFRLNFSTSKYFGRQKFT